MPFEFGNKVAVSKDELIPAFYNNYENLKKTLQRYKEQPYGPKRIMFGGNGRQLLVDYDTLPPQIKQAIPDPRKCDHILERFYEVDGDAVRFYSLFEFADGSNIKSEIQEKYIVNASVLHAVLRLREARISDIIRKGGKVKGITQSLLSDAISFNRTLLAKHHTEHTLPSSLRHFKAALNNFETLVDGHLNYVSLISGKHKNDNSRKVFDHTEELLNNMYADKKRKPTATDVHNDYDAFLTGYLEVHNNVTGEFYDPKNFKKISFATINKYLKQWRNQVATHQKRSDNRELKMGKYKPPFSFEMPKLAGSIISIDDRQPPFKTLEGKRVWFYLGVDIASRAIICQVYGDSKEGIIREFYRQLVRNYHMWGLNLPGELECEMSLNSSYVETFLKEGAMFRYVKMEANNPRGKYIERVNEELRYRKEKKREGWIARPKARKESNQPGVDTEKIKKLPYERIINECLQDIEDWNNEEHPDVEGLSRWDYFQQRQHEGVDPTNYKSFMRYIGNRTETSCNIGNIHLNKSLFLIADGDKVAKGEKLIAYMDRIEGRDLEVFWLDDNDGKVFKALAYVGGEYACELIEKPRPNRARMERTEKDTIAESILAAYTNTVDSYAKRKMSTLDQLTIIDNRPKPERRFKIDQLTRTVAKPFEFPVNEEVTDDMEMPYVSSRKSLKDRF
ncbi:MULTISPECIES: hypothetical protein [Sphingobacterium]|uniref:hypothetical protein n=1 Tax=Sphingobacterium TaxID=28453 RepID=UPI00257C8609|nr:MULTISPECIES: hypothetical protein [Sphingobacterium]